MSSRTRIVVLHMKEIIYTAIFAALAILLIILLIVMFRPSGKSAASGEKKQYTPGVYTSTLTLKLLSQIQKSAASAFPILMKP